MSSYEEYKNNLPKRLFSTLKLLSSILQKLTSKLSQNNSQKSRSFRSQTRKKFQSLISLQAPKLKFIDFLARIAHFSEFSENIFIYAFLVLQKCLMKEDRLNDSHIFKLYAGCLFLSHKYLSENGSWKTEDFSLIVGLQSEKKLREIEETILYDILKFRIHICEKKYFKILKLIEVTNLVQGDYTDGEIEETRQMVDGDFAKNKKIGFKFNDSVMNSKLVKAHSLDVQDKTRKQKQQQWNKKLVNQQLFIQQGLNIAQKIFNQQQKQQILIQQLRNFAFEAKKQVLSNYKYIIGSKNQLSLKNQYNGIRKLRKI